MTENPGDRGAGRDRGDQEAHTGTGTQGVIGGCIKTHSGVGHRDRAGQKGGCEGVGPDSGTRRAEEKRREMRAALSLREVRRDKRRAQAAATGPV